MKLIINKQAKLIVSILIFSIAIMLSGSAFAVKPDNVAKPDYATQADLDAVIADIAELQAIHSPPQIGDQRGGGIVFYVDKIERKVLIVSIFDQSNAMRWDNGVYLLTGAEGDGVGAGALNTAIIVAAQGAGNYAAKLAYNYSVLEDGINPCTGLVDEICRTDWYLPSKHELNLLYQQKEVVDGIATFDYWSSTELDATSAWVQNFYSGYQNTGTKGSTIRVRAVRAFTY